MAQEPSIMELDQIITSHQRLSHGSLDLIPLHCLHYLLATSRFKRYELSEQKEDLDKSIVHYTEAIFLPPSWGFYLNVVQVFFQLILSLLCRSKKFKRPEDAKCAVEYLRYLRGLPLDTFEVPRNVVTTSLVQALAVQVNLEAGKHVQPLDEVIQCLRDALKICPPDLDLVPLGLAAALIIRFKTIYLNDDYEEAMALLESVIASRPPEDDPSQTRIRAVVTILARVRVSIYPNPEYLEEAISRCRTLLSSSSLDNDLRHIVTHEMALLSEMRFNNFGLTEALQESHSYTSEMVSLASSSSAHSPFQEEIDTVDAIRATYPMMVIEEKIHNLCELISKTTPGNPDHKTYLERLVFWYHTKFSRTNDMKDLEEVMKYRRMLLLSSDPSHPFGCKVAFNLGNDLYAAFECSNMMGYLDESITVHRGALKMQSARPFHFILIQQLFVSLSKRFRLLGRRQDLDEIIELFPLGVNDKFATTSSVSVAYKKAMSLIQSSLVSAPTLQIQHARLVAMRGLWDNMPLDYASYQIDMGQFTQAIETLERGRALLWSEMRGLRNSMDHLSGFNSPLATKLAAINKDLESLTVSVTPSGTIEISDGGSQVDDGMDPFGRLVVKQQKLLKERDVSYRRSRITRFGDFLKTPSFENICVAASHGPVVIINHSEWCSDILILLHDSPPSCISTTKDFYRRANELRDRLVVARKEGLDSDRYERALRSVLEGLYNLVGKPVIDRLRTLGVPEQSRIWWCPTSVFCSFHFISIYPFIYTDTLCTDRISQTQSKNVVQPSLLLVANPDESLPGAFGEMSVIQSLKSRVPVATLCGKNATPADVVEGLRHHGFAHFVCRGTLETGKPFDASFKLFDDERLTLLDIVRSRLPAGEFAFLAACHTAELTDESIADEGLHLTAAVQYCGFRSVVGTMWEMADIDGREIAESFYKSMFSGNGKG
ncbi:hypothetical protein B0F90DRAFT_1669104 [Multifurca ochricompacta]|uniref:CHAT domain-containing protein n=1 Tax=Multifurca ochricompacta TaxID=376703 RepID=A0AAD4M161_9AGAM|nr:hypothetical protein B0F90DRAFT_1669104 [Multifurca ochricompacta]